MKNTLFTVLICFIAASVAAVDTNALTAVERAAQRERLHMRATRATGGYCRKPGVGKGKILVLNTQSRAEFKNCKTVFYSLNHMMRLPMEYRDGTIPGGKPCVKAVKELNATFAIFVIDDSGSQSAVLVSPEERWATVNVNSLALDNPTPSVLESRLHKEILRAFGWLCGAGNSKARNSVMGPVASYVDLDGIPIAEYPIDLYKQTDAYLRGMGVVPFTVTTYRRACQEGWAPQPTNENQKAIWDEVHTIPKNPIKIEFDPKTDK